MLPDMLPALRNTFGERLQENVTLAAYTSARIGGPADALLNVKTASELADTITRLWKLGIPYTLLGGGSNVLVSDRGVRGLVVLNRAREVRFETGDEPRVWTESGASLSSLANRAAEHGYAGLEWAAAVPGSVGGAVYGNAGAFGGDMAHNLIHAEVLTEKGLERWQVEKMEYGYRTSLLKRSRIKCIILTAEMRLIQSTREAVKAKVAEFVTRRKATQPLGASMGSMFKNPPGDYAGRLIEAAGLKGTRIGNAEVSSVHGNFFINRGSTSAADICALISLVQRTVAQKFGTKLELEIEMIGDWDR